MSGWKYSAFTILLFLFCSLPFHFFLSPFPSKLALKPLGAAEQLTGEWMEKGYVGSGPEQVVGA